MDKSAIQGALSPEAGSLIEEILTFSEIDSTNLEATRRLKAGATNSCLIVAETQSAGRGRRGRKWVSPPGGVYLSLVLPIPAASDSIQGLSLISALSVLETLQLLGADDLQLKWPNDVLARGRKLAGVLLELHTGNETDCLVFGIGVNLKLPPQAVAAIERPAIDLATLTGAGPAPANVVGAIVSALLGNVERFRKSGFAPFQEQWNRHDRYLQQDIVIQHGYERTIGKAVGVDERGALVLQSADGRKVISGGEIFPSLEEAPGAPDKPHNQ